MKLTHTYENHIETLKTTLKTYEHHLQHKKKRANTKEKSYKSVHKSRKQMKIADKCTNIIQKRMNTDFS